MSDKIQDTVIQEAQKLQKRSLNADHTPLTGGLSPLTTGLGYRLLRSNYVPNKVFLLTGGQEGMKCDAKCRQEIEKFR